MRSWITPLSLQSLLPWEDKNFSHDLLELNVSKSTPLSLVIPIYNSGAFLEKTLRSLLYSDLTNVELIVSDGGSEDNTHEILDHYSGLFKRIISEPDSGQSDAINKGFQVASGQILGWLNGDDILLPYALNIVRNFSFNNPAAELLIGDGFMTEQDFTKINHFQYTIETTSYDCLLDYASSHLIQPSVFFSKKAWSLCGPLNIHDHYAMDADLFISMSKRVKRACIQKDIAYSVYHEDCKTRGKRAESITQLALVQAKHGGLREAEKTLAILTNLYNQRVPPSTHGTATQDNSDFSNAESAKIDSLVIDQASQETKFKSVALVCTNILGGAGIACERQYENMIKRGYKVEIFTIFRHDSHHIKLNYLPIKNKSDGVSDNTYIHHFWNKNTFNSNENAEFFKGDEMFSRFETPVDWSQSHILFENFDIIHFHWSPCMLDSNQQDEILQCLKGKLVFISLHDMNFFTGGCHYSQGCDAFKENCTNCHLFTNNEALAELYLLQKANLYEKISGITVLCPSENIANQARQSKVFRKARIEIIDNFMSDAVKEPCNKLVARVKLNLPLDQRLLLIGADSLSNPRKGSKLMSSFFEEVEKLSRNVQIVVFGRSSISYGHTTFWNRGFISDSHEMSLIYSSCDAFAMLSLEENAPQVAIESLSMGCPVVSFNVGNLSQLISHDLDGYLCKVGDVKTLAKAAVHIIQQKYDDTRFRLQRAMRLSQRINNSSTYERLNELYRASY